MNALTLDRVHVCCLTTADTKATEHTTVYYSVGGWTTATVDNLAANTYECRRTLQILKHDKYIRFVSDNTRSSRN